MHKLIKKSKLVPAADVTAMLNDTFVCDNECIRGSGGKPVPLHVCYSSHPREKDGNKQRNGKPPLCSL